ncbi:GNAT family N-acetyltransferase [Glaciihabitans sp. dw_435]|uniref:GNAT family N-acetyltransferase n=1 Tax=Glaciihabitans sp. dw_435 TaxID=2720081 RepID=UPI001BD5AB4A|nr:GNAT family N-acetyltransferase [Glaciihabitans sp. dw_435]
MSTAVVHAPNLNRYQLLIDGEVSGFTEYHLSGNDIVFTHTEVDPARQEHGLGGELVTGALDQVRDDTSYRLVAVCPFIVSWLTKHPEYQDLQQR